MSTSTREMLYGILVVTVCGLGVAVFCAAIAGWVINVIWMFHQDGIGPFALGLLGVFVPPVGAIHGVWLWW